jgi:hypothetical protein
MKWLRIGILGTLAWLGVAGNVAHAGRFGLAVGINLGGPCCYRPYYPYGYCYPAYPVYVAPAPVVVQQAPAAQPAQLQAASPNLRPVPETAQASASSGQQNEVRRNLQLLGAADERVRADSVMQLGRLRAPEAVDPLAATLAGDRSPEVREAAARALGLIGSSKGLPALQRAAQIDSDRDVRHSAQFAMEVIQTR